MFQLQHSCVRIGDFNDLFAVDLLLSSGDKRRWCKEGRSAVALRILMFATFWHTCWWSILKYAVDGASLSGGAIVELTLRDDAGQVMFQQHMQQLDELRSVKRMWCKEGQWAVAVSMLMQFCAHRVYSHHMLWSMFSQSMRYNIFWWWNCTKQNKCTKLNRNVTSVVDRGTFCSAAYWPAPWAVQQKWIGADKVAASKNARVAIANEWIPSKHYWEVVWSAAQIASCEVSSVFMLLFKKTRFIPSINVFNPFIDICHLCYLLIIQSILFLIYAIH